jgi:hypothetical protein
MPEHGVAVEVNGHHRCRRHGIVSHARKIREVSNDTDASLAGSGALKPSFG